MSLPSPSRHRRKGALARPRPAAAAHRETAGGWQPLWLLAAALVGWSHGFTRMVNSDLWFHLAAGREIATAFAIPRVDPWSFTAAGQPWHNHEWLAGVFFYLWSRWLAVESLVFWQWLLLAATAAVWFDLARRFCAPPVTMAALLGAFATAAPFFDIRPTLWTLLFFAVLLRLTLHASRAARLLPLLFLLWANLHGGFVFGFAALAVVVAAHRLAPASPATGGTERMRREGPWLLAACGLATLLNPFGWGAWSYPLRLAGAGDSPSRTILYEWLPPFVPGGPQSPLFVPWLVLGAGGCAALLASRERRREPLALAVCGLTFATAAMALTSRRFIVLYAFAAGLALALAASRWKLGRGRGAQGVAVAAVLLLACGRLAGYPLGREAFVALTRSDRMPEEELRFALANDLTGDVFAYFLWGGYVHWRTDGALRVFLDPRSETVFTPEIQRRYFAAAAQAPGWQDVVANSGARYVLWPFAPAAQRRFVEGLLRSGRWRLVYSGPQAVLLARSELSLPANLEPTPPSPWRAWGHARQAIGDGDLERAERLLVESIERAPPILPEACHDLEGVRRRLGRATPSAVAERLCDRVRFTRAGR